MAKKQNNASRLANVLSRWDDIQDRAAASNIANDLAFLDDFLSEPIKDEVVRLPYEEPAEHRRVWQ